MATTTAMAPAQALVHPDALMAMREIERHGPRSGETFGRQQVVERQFRRLLELGGHGVDEFVHRLLHGEFGPDAAATASGRLQGGMVVKRPTGESPVLSAAAFCIEHGAVDVLRAVLLPGPPPNLCTEVAVEPHTMQRWMELLCTTFNERSAFDYTAPNAYRVLTGLAAAAHASCSTNSQDALELAWELDRGHESFHVLVDEPTPAGAAVRDFCMRKRLAAGAAAPGTPQELTTAPTTLRARRASI